MSSQERELMLNELINIECTGIRPPDSRKDKGNCVRRFGRRGCSRPIVENQETGQ